MISELHKMHFDVMLIHHNAPNFPHRAEFAADRPGDWTSKVYPEDVWWQKIKDQLAAGVDSLWQDTRQNDVTDGVIWSGLQNYFGASRRVLFMGNRNVALTDPWSSERDDAIAWTSLLASRRYPFRWTGDISTTWNELRFQIHAITNSEGSMKGVSYLTADAFAKSWQHQARWNQFLAFSPVARSHTMKPWDAQLDVHSLEKIMKFQSNKIVDRQELASELDQDAIEDWVEKNAPNTKTAENSIRKYLQLRYRLLPYIYSAAHEHYVTGMPIARPMSLAFPADPLCQYDRWPYEYMFGDAFLVAPVYAELKSMEIYLPQGGDWVDYWNHTVYPGGEVLDYDTSDAEKLPLFVKAGSIIPMRKEAEWIEPGMPDNPLFLDIYPGSGASAAVLYEDDGQTTEYQSGRFATTDITSSLDTSSPDGHGVILLALGPARGDYRGKAGNRAFEITVNLVGKVPGKVLKDAQSLPRLTGGAALQAVSEGWSYDEAEHAVKIKVALPSSSAAQLRIFLE
jgi:alpha-glucosidase (family GH31 glycosyl hydrolase)